MRPPHPKETLVFGTSRPGYPNDQIGPDIVGAWLEKVQARGVGRIVCLLGPEQLDYYAPALIDQYRARLGVGEILHEPVEDYRLISSEGLQRVIRFICDGVHAGRPTVVHCSAGHGRTGHVLAGWLVCDRGLDPEPAIQVVATQGFNAEEAVRPGGPTFEELIDLLASCRASCACARHSTGH